MQRLLLALAILGPALGCAGGPPADDPAAEPRIQEAFELEAETAAPGDDAPAPPRLSLVKAGPTSYTPWHLEFSTAEACAAFKVEGAHVFARHDRWADAFVPANFLAQNAMWRAPGLVWADTMGAVIVPPPAPAEPVASRALTETIVRGGLQGLKGKGVTIAIVDSGLDFRHPDFIAPDGSSRVKAFWDTTSLDHLKGLGKPGPVTYPNGVGIGTVYTREQLTAELRAPVKKLPPGDVNGHGTSCGSIAAGNGAAYPDRRYAGVAPEADLVVARIGGSDGRGLENAYLLGAICAWIDEVAGKSPAVVSCSFGGQYAGRDGTFVQERQLDSRFGPAVKGRSLVIAAGNEAQQTLHAETRIEGESAPGSISWKVPEGSRASLIFHVGLANRFDVGWKSAGKTEAVVKATDFHPLSKQVRLQVVAGPGEYTLQLWSRAGKAAAVDAYISSLGGILPPAFVGPSAKPGKQIACPGTTLNAVTVGSYDFNAQVDIGGKTLTLGRKQGTVFVPLPIGFLSAYSNHGPRRTGDSVKPDLVAPGQWHTAARILGKAKGPNEFLETSGKYTYFNGTSAATPYVSGVIALMYEKNPGLTVAEVRSLLHGKMTPDAQTGSVPNAAWGHGKMDLKAVQAVLAAVKKP